MIEKIYKLSFVSPLRVSGGGYGLETTMNYIHSDTLFSAICSVAAHLFSKKELTQYFFSTQPNIKVSSAFPYVNDTLYLPKPHHFYPELDYEDLKKWRKTKFISTAAFQEIITGQFSVLKEDNPNEYIKNRELPRVTIDRVSDAAALFFFEEMIFSQEAGLYFIASFQDTTAQEKFECALRLLGDEGIGSDRHLGKGHFDFRTIDEPQLPRLATTPNAICLLSLYMPKSDELAHIDLEKSYYKIKSRQGWVMNKTLRRKTIRVFTEGSVLHLRPNVSSDALIGQLQSTDFTKEIGYKVYRNGRLTGLPLKIKA